jgi:hypothetical protein
LGLVGKKTNKMKKLFIIACLVLVSVATFAQRDLGYRGFLDLGGGIGVTPASRFMVGLSTVHGYQAAPFLFVGVGIAANDIAYKTQYGWESEGNDGIVTPVFGDIRLDLGAGKFSPFIDLRGGYDFICGNGLYLNPSIGVHYAMSDNFGFNLSIGYDLQKTKNDYIWDGERKNTLGYLSVKFGIDF